MCPLINFTMGILQRKYFLELQPKPYHQRSFGPFMDYIGILPWDVIVHNLFDFLPVPFYT